ncbi:MAG: cupin [Rhizobiales bacterium 35-68-8]|nr:MAG: cupin [Rhizobiales bacterium 35-68-8]
MTAAEVIALLGLDPHPEGGHFRETFRETAEAGARGASTAIYFLLAEGQRSHWHRVDASEAWHFYAGAPLKLEIVTAEGERSAHILSQDLAAGHRPQAVVPPHGWQSAQSLGAWTLVGCTVAPAFDFAGFELAPPGWEPA